MPAKKGQAKTANKKLYRSQKDRVIAGVCAGLGEFFGFDPTVIRIIFVVITLFGGGGVILYLILWLIMPTQRSNGEIDEESIKANAEEIKLRAHEFAQNARQYSKGHEARPLLGIFLLIVGFLLLFQNFGFFRFFNFWRLWPILIIIIAFSMLTRNERD
jgi:phage shock protein C